LVLRLQPHAEALLPHGRIREHYAHHLGKVALLDGALADGERAESGGDAGFPRMREGARLSRAAMRCSRGAVVSPLTFFSHVT
jgi:hypothetical protein